ncbi:MAG: tyrosine-type recombinase/integrase [Oscillatoriales cyanobacterium C42_A2020_001]|nr:tyrosine-type recombinase/integrase [Leptolyngbyaceae cyanobacterium C42_A2020_001]
MGTGKNQKGTVVVGAVRERLRLRWSYQGKRYFLYLELPDSAVNRKVAEAKAGLIERDMATEQFDATLDRYRAGSNQSALTVAELFNKFTQERAKRNHAQSMAKYQGLQGYLGQFFRGKLAANLSEKDAEKFREWLGKKIEPVTLRERISLLNACWKWGLKKRWVTANPWEEIKVRVPRKQRPQPFTEEEIKRIVQGFREKEPHYLDYVEFCLGTGCRLGEAIALQWQHLTDDCSGIWIGESVSRGRRKATKTNKARVFGLSSRLQQMLLARRPADYKADDLVFPAPKGGAIDDHNFRNRAWSKVLAKAGVDYRKPYTVTLGMTTADRPASLPPTD